MSVMEPRHIHATPPAPPVPMHPAGGGGVRERTPWTGWEVREGPAGRPKARGGSSEPQLEARHAAVVAVAAPTPAYGACKRRIRRAFRAHTGLAHRAWHGTVLRYDHPFWRSHYPPNGWHCRCTVLQYSDDDLKRRGYTPSEGPPPGSDKTRQWLNKHTGEVHQAPRGIDPGFQHNAGTIGCAAFIKPPEVEAKAKAIGAHKAEQDAPLTLPAFLRRESGAPQPDLDAGARAVHTDRPAETAAAFRKRPDYRPEDDLPGEAAQYYGESRFRGINRAFRAGKSLATTQRRITDDMVSAMQETTEDIEVWRGRDTRIDYAVGDKIDEQAFSSWSASWRTAQSFAGGWVGHVGKESGTLYRLRLPKGSRAVVENEVEQEVLLRSGAKYRAAEIIDNAEKGADDLYRGPSRVYLLELTKERTDGRHWRTDGERRSDRLPRRLPDRHRPRQSAPRRRDPVPPQEAER